MDKKVKKTTKKKTSKKLTKKEQLIKFYRNNRIFCILMIISVICVIIIGTSAIVYFVKQSKTSAYGTRLEEKENYNFSEDQKKIDEFYKGQEIVTGYKIDVKGKIIYITLNVKDETTKEQAENLGVEALDLISKENFEYYDVQFLINRPSYDTYGGSCSKSATLISWNRTYDVEKNTKSE